MTTLCYLDHLAALERKEEAERQTALPKCQEKRAMSMNVVDKVNLCDPALEPSDEDLARLTVGIAQEAAKLNGQVAAALHAEIEREIAIIHGWLSQPCQIKVAPR